MRKSEPNLPLKNLKAIFLKSDGVADRISEIIKERQQLECLKRKREGELELMRATAFIKVFDELTDGKPRYLDPERKNSEVVYRLAYDVCYRRARNSIRRSEIRLARLKAEENVLQAQVKRLEAEQKLLLMEIEK